MNPYLYSNSESYAGHQGAVLCAVYCEELDAFITGGDDHSIRIWPVAADEPGVEKPADKAGVEQHNVVLLEHTDRVTGLVCMGHTLASVSWDLTLRLWNLQAALQPDQVAISRPLCCLSLLIHSPNASVCSLTACSLTSEQSASSHLIEDAHDDYILSLTHSLA